MGLRLDQGDEVLHIGATWLPPAVRTWLHLHHEDPEIGRVRAATPEALEGDVQVWAFEVSEGLDRQTVRRVVMELLDGGEVPDVEEQVLDLARTIVARTKEKLST